MRPLRRQQGLSFALVGVVLLLVVVGILGTQAVSRLLLQNRSDERVQARFGAASRALAQYVATSQRLPCPADPALDTGDEVLPGAGAATCAFPEGTLPWNTVGLAREESIDPWGYKISYRVYTGSAGSLTQPGGASMVQCDTSDPSPGSVTSLAGSAGALCQPQPLVTKRSTPPGSYVTAGFLHSKGFTVTDMGAAVNGVAYVLISHGATGHGAYSAAGKRDLDAKPLNSPEELANMGSAGPFVIKAFSGRGTDPASVAHFDDHVAYRKIEELIRSAGLYARDWPEEVTTSQQFTQAAIETAIGRSITPGASIGEVTVTFTGVVVTGIDSGGSPTAIGFDVVGGYGGIGVAGGGSMLLQSSLNESLRFTFEPRSKFAITLNEFGTYSGGNREEIAELRFYASGSLVATRFAHGCNPDGGLASFSIADIGTTFDRVDVVSHEAWRTTNNTYNGLSAFLVSEIKVCAATDSTCTTSLATVGNTCTNVTNT